MADIKERLDNLRIHIQEPEFLEGKGLSNEVNIRIFCYDAEDEMTVRQFIDQITTDRPSAVIWWNAISMRHSSHCAMTLILPMLSPKWKRLTARSSC